jgi:hypothetical protein
MEPSRPSATPLKTGTGATVAGGGEPPYDGNMEHRVTSLEARWDAIVPTLATKADVAELRAEMQQSFADMRAEMQQSFAEMRAEMQESSAEIRMEMRQSFGDVRAEMQRMSSDNKSWLLATVLTIIGTMLAAILGISQIYRAAPPPVPIIITLPSTAPITK